MSSYLSDITFRGKLTFNWNNFSFNYKGHFSYYLLKDTVLGWQCDHSGDFLRTEHNVLTVRKSSVSIGWVGRGKLVEGSGARHSGTAGAVGRTLGGRACKRKGHGTQAKNTGSRGKSNQSDGNYLRSFLSFWESFHDSKLDLIRAPL